MNRSNRYKDIGYLIAYIVFNFLLLYGIYFFTYALRRYSNARRSKQTRSQGAAAVTADRDSAPQAKQEALQVPPAFHIKEASV